MKNYLVIERKDGRLYTPEIGTILSFNKIGQTVVEFHAHLSDEIFEAEKISNLLGLILEAGGVDVTSKEVFYRASLDVWVKVDLGTTTIKSIS